MRTHGEGYIKNMTPEYKTWLNIRNRCNNENVPNYSYYGGRGITVCERWENSYENFLEDMGRRPSADYSIERINNNGNYEPINCRWATRSEQQENRRKRGILYNKRDRRWYGHWQFRGKRYHTKYCRTESDAMTEYLIMQSKVLCAIAIAVPDEPRQQGAA